MKTEESYLIELLNAFLSNQKITLDESVDYSRLFSVTKAQNLIAITHCLIKNSNNKGIVSPEIYKMFNDAFYETIYRYDQQEQIINDLDKLLSNNKIRHVFFKGAELKTLYPVPEVRMMNDIDVLIDEKNRDMVKNLLVENGYKIKNSNGPVYDYLKNGWLIEMHTKIVSGKVGNSNAESSFLDAINHAEFNGYKGSFDSNYNLAYLITHIAHHFWFYGAGIKMILDLAVFQKAFKIDYDAVFDKLNEIGLGDFSKVILTVCYKWFGVGIDYKVDTIKTEEFIVSFGAFGNSNRNQSAVIKRKELEEGKQNSPFITRLRLLFPSYSKLKDLPYISFINGKPWLTPFAWIYRFFYNLKYRKAFMMGANSKIGDEKTNIEAENELEYFKEIGLL